jgi:hypothetical protein
MEGETNATKYGSSVTHLMEAHGRPVRVAGLCMSVMHRLRNWQK